MLPADYPAAPAARVSSAPPFSSPGPAPSYPPGYRVFVRVFLPRPPPGCNLSLASYFYARVRAGSPLPASFGFVLRNGRSFLQSKMPQTRGHSHTLISTTSAPRLHRYSPSARSPVQNFGSSSGIPGRIRLPSGSTWRRTYSTSPRRRSGSSDSRHCSTGHYAGSLHSTLCRNRLDTVGARSAASQPLRSASAIVFGLCFFVLPYESRTRSSVWFAFFHRSTVTRLPRAALSARCSASFAARSGSCLGTFPRCRRQSRSF